MANFVGEFVTILFGEAPLVGECLDELATQILAVGQAQETNQAQTITPTVTVVIGQATEINVAQPIATLAFFPFLTITEADERCEQQVVDGTWVVCHSQRILDGTIAVRFQRFMSPLNPDFGKWDFAIDKTVN